MSINSIKILCVNNDRVETAHFVTIGMFSDDFNGEAQVKEPDEITKWEWFSLDNLPSPLFKPSINVIRNYKKNMFYIPE